MRRLLTRCRCVHSVALPVDELLRHGPPSMPSHHGQLSSRQRDVGEDACSCAASPSRSGFVLPAGARRDAEEAGLGVDRPQPAVGAGPHPGDVVADRPDLPALLARRRHQHGEVGLAARARERRRDVGRLAGGLSMPRISMCSASQPSSRRHEAGDAQREALLAEQRVAAVARADRPDEPLLGEVQMKRRSGLEVAERVQALHEVVRGCRGARAPAWPMRVMIRMLATTYGLSVISTPIWLYGEATGPMTYGTTYIVRPRIAPANSAPSFCLASAGAIQLLFGPASSLPGRADEGQVLGARDVVRVAAMQVAVRIVLRDSARSASRCRASASMSRWFSASEPSHQEIRSGRVTAATSSTHRSTGFAICCPLVPYRGCGSTSAARRCGDHAPLTQRFTSAPMCSIVLTISSPSRR